MHQQYKHVLVDEYQDINEIQDAILALASCEAKGKAGNLFCVGDVKQSIFRFRLADPRRFFNRYERFKADPSAGVNIDLQENFRSREPLLEAVNSVFERLMSDKKETDIEYDDSHRLKNGRKYPAIQNQPTFSGAAIELHLVPKDLTPEDGHANSDQEEMKSAEYEAILVARQIQKMMGRDGSPRMCVIRGDDQPTPINYGDIVILLRGMRVMSDAFADFLRAHCIPVFSESGSGFFQATEVRDILSLLEVLDNQHQDIPLAAVLRSPLAEIGGPDNAAAARIRLAYPEKEISFHQAVVKFAAEKKGDALAEKLTEFLQKLADWRDQANKRPVAEVIWQIYEDTGYLVFCSGLSDGAAVREFD